MLLHPGARLGPYEVVASLGAGGMGEVYRARDTRLGRTVAIKTLAGPVADSAEFRARFQREARIVSALSHPHICALFDIGQHEGLDYVVIEYLDGETLEQRLRRGRLAVDQAIAIGTQVADALAAAHAAGVVHRDLKPSNIMLTTGGPKLLDFGIARLVDVCASRDAAETASSQTELTERGTLLGTLQYMAPEQIRGEPADARTDIFALGAVLYEMCAGEKAFSGSTRTAIMVAILEHATPPLASHGAIPHLLDVAVSGCLEKAPEDRWQSARDVSHLLKRARSAEATPQQPARSARRAWLTGAAVVGALLVLAAIGRDWHGPTAPLPAAVTFTLDLPVETGARVPLDPFTTISPDGRHVAFTQENPSGGGDLWVRSLDTLEVRALPGTDGAFVPFWSPDSQQIAFFTLTDNQLKVVRSSGSAVRVLCFAHSPLGGSWAVDGTVLFSAVSAATESSSTTSTPGLYRVSQNGGVPAPVPLSLGEVAGTQTVRRYGARAGWPQFLPDGRQFLFRDRDSGTVRLAAIGSADSVPLLDAESHAIHAAPGFLLFVRDTALMAQAFDASARRMSGEPFRVVDNIRFNEALGGGDFSASTTGALAFSHGGSLGPSRATWMARDGRTLESFGLDIVSDIHRLSPDGRRLVQDRPTAGDRGDLWVFDLVRRTSERLTSSAADEESAIWSPDGREVAYAANPRGVFDLYRISATTGARETTLLTSSRDKRPEDWSADGRYIVFVQSTAERGDDLWLLDLSRPNEPMALVESPAIERDARFSPDARWIAYRSTRTGRPEIYIQPVAGGSAVLASVNGGFKPFWSPDGKELFFISLDRQLMSVRVRVRVDGGNSPALETDPPMALFTVPENCGGARCVQADIARDRRFLLVTATASAKTPMTVILNWRSLASANALDSN
jgi:Tol biopolymer transport system component